MACSPLCQIILIKVWSLSIRLLYKVENHCLLELLAAPNPFRSRKHHDLSYTPTWPLHLKNHFVVSNLSPFVLFIFEEKAAFYIIVLGHFLAGGQSKPECAAMRFKPRHNFTKEFMTNNSPLPLFRAPRRSM